jgi:hypothetical protein
VPCHVPSSLRQRLVREVAAALVDVGRCPDAVSAIASAVERTMEGHGGCLPRDVLLSNLAAGDVPPVALLRIVHHFNQVHPFSSIVFCC